MIYYVGPNVFNSVEICWLRRPKHTYCNVSSCPLIPPCMEASTFVMFPSSFIILVYLQLSKYKMLLFALQLLHYTLHYSMYPPDIPSHYTVHAFLMLRLHILTTFNLSSMYVFFLILIFTLILIISIHGRAVSSTALRVWQIKPVN